VLESDRLTRGCLITSVGRRITKTAERISRRAAPGSRTPRAPQNISVAIVGAGRMGTALGLALKAIGYRIEVVATKRPASAARAAKAFGPATLALSAKQLRRLSSEQTDRINRCSVILIAAPDDVIGSVGRQLVDIVGSLPVPSRTPARRVALHTSGALASDVLKPMRSAGFAVGSLHPLVSISESRAGAKLLTHAFFSVEGDRAAVRAAESLVKALGGESFPIHSDRKALYHAAALTASPHMTALFDIAVDMLGVCGLKPGRARRILLPLLESTVGNLAKQDPARALTGTFKRGDKATVEMHLAALKQAKLPQALSVYVALGQRSIAMARKLSANPHDLDEIARLLSRATKD
jgi:predicted short-subunit dehydrogenase-like oxidoreductase (DUF2520 family)